MEVSHVYSNHGKELMSGTFINRSDIKIVYAKEFLTHDGYDNYGPQSDIWDLYVCVQDVSTKIYTYYHYTTEYWYDGNTNIMKYELYKNYISSNYLVTPYCPGNFYGDTHGYMYSVFRVLNKIDRNMESEWNKVSKYDLESINFYLDDIELDPFTVVKLSND
jgi:hypothetical protein